MVCHKFYNLKCFSYIHPSVTIIPEHSNNSSILTDYCVIAQLQTELLNAGYLLVMEYFYITLFY